MKTDLFFNFLEGNVVLCCFGKNTSGESMTLAQQVALWTLNKAVLQKLTVLMIVNS